MRRREIFGLWGIGGAGVAAVLMVMALGLGQQQTTTETQAPPEPAKLQPAPAPQPVASVPTLPPSQEKLRFGPLTRQHLAQYDDWIKETPRNHYFIQLLATDATHTGEVEGFLSRAVAAIEPTQIRAYRSSLSGRDRIGVIYGDFSTREDAIAAMQALPDSIRTIQPFPRQVSKLH